MPFSFRWCGSHSLLSVSLLGASLILAGCAAMKNMGARREAIQASGVGKTDLAVPTPDGIKEAKNRSTVITLIP